MTTPFPKTLFVYKRGGLDTAEIRGRQIARELECDSIPLRELTAEIGARYGAIIYVKRMPETKILAELKRRGVRQAFDVLDNYSERTARSASDHVDAFIGANLTQTIHLQRRYSAAAVEIPHHHCNFDNLRIPRRTGLPVIGFISTPDRWSRNLRLAKKTGYALVTNVSRKGPRGFEAMIEAYMGTDIGFAYRITSDKLRFNCANKLTNFMSFGIPSVLTPESGYLEYGRHGETVLYAYTTEDFVDMIRWLGQDIDLRARMGDACYEAAKPFHITRIADRYREFLSGL